MKYIKVILIIVVFVLVFAFLNRLVMPKYATDLVEGSFTKEYYAEEKDHEVIFIGDCEVYANISPMVMYENYGITAYVRGNSQQLIWQSYYLLKETLKYEIPKVVVFNVNSMRYSEPVSEPYNRLMLDEMPLSKEKIELIKASMTEEENILSYIFPILRYHSRFSELTKEDFTYLFKDKKITHNGFLINQNVKPVGTLPIDKKLPTYEFKDIDYEYLDKIYELCQDNNIELVLMKAPSVYPYWYPEYESQIVEYASSHNIAYYNFINVASEIGIDYNTDTYDGGLHLNLDGATKLSTYFGKILKENYDLTDYRNYDKINTRYENKLKAYYEEIKGEND